MANHVNSRVYFSTISEEGKAKLQEILSRAPETGDTRWFGQLWVDGKEGSPSEDEVQQYNWMVNNVGAKWTYIEECDEDSMMLMSAWSAPLEGIEWLVDQIATVDPSVVAEVRYEDEMPNFVGVAVFNSEGRYYQTEWDDSELREDLMAANPELAEHWDAEEEEGDDEFWDMFNDLIWDHASDLQIETLDDIYADLKEGNEE